MTGELLASAPGRAYQFGGDGRQLAFGHQHTAGVWQVWDHSAYQLLVHCTDPVGNVELQFSPDGRLLVSTAEKGETKIWNIRTRRLAAQLPNDGGGSVLFRVADRSVITVGAEGVWRWKLNVVPIQQTLQVGPPKKLLSHVALPSVPRRGSLSRNGRLLGLVADWRRALLVDLEGEREPIPLEGHAGVSEVVLDPNERWAVTTTWLGEDVWLWDAHTGERLRDLWPEHGSTFAAFSPDGKWLVASVAVGDYTRVIQLRPDLAAAYERRAWAGRCAGDFGQAIGDYRKLLELRPGDVHARLILARLYVTCPREEREPQAAREILAEAMRAAPNDPACFRTLGFVYYQTADYTGAIDALEHARQPSPSPPIVEAYDCWLLAMSHYGRGEPGPGRAYLTQAGRRYWSQGVAAWHAFSRRWQFRIASLWTLLTKSPPPAETERPERAADTTTGR